MSSVIKKRVELEIEIFGCSKKLKCERSRGQGWVPANRVSDGT
jgi:hypothetical protein